MNAWIALVIAALLWPNHDRAEEDARSTLGREGQTDLKENDGNPERKRRGVKNRRTSNDKESYMRWLEGMWDVHKFDLYGSMEREEKRTEEVLEIFRGLGELSRCRVEAPPFTPWRPS